MNMEEPRLELDVASWGTFKLIDLFDIEKIKNYGNEFTEDPGGIPFIGNTIVNAGAVRWVSLEPELAPHEPNCLTVSVSGSKIVLNGAFREEQFYATITNINIFRLKKVLMTKNIGQFLISVLKLIGSSKYRHFGYNLTASRLKKETIKLPQTPAGEPDWDFMENYIQQLKEDIPPILEVHQPTLELDVDSWDEFKIVDLFDWERPRGMLIKNTTPGNIPAINASKENEGVHSLISEVVGYPTHRGNCITRPTDGDVPHATYRKAGENFIPVAALIVYRLKDKEMTKEIGLFIVTIMRLLAGKFGFGYKLNTTRMKAETIKLPTTPEGTPDWDFMERYISQFISDRYQKV